MKICLVTPDIVGPIQNGGIGTFCAHLLDLLQGHELTLVFTAAAEKGSDPNWRGHYLRKGIRVVTLRDLQTYAEQRNINPQQDRFLQRSWMIYQWLAGEQFDLVHFQDWGANGFYAIRAQRTGLAFSKTRLAVTVHSPSKWLRQGMREWPEDTLGHLRLNYAERYCIEHAGAALFPSSHMRDWCRSEGWQIPETHWVLPCPYVHKAAAPDKKSIDPAHLIFFGRLEARKGLDLFLSALERILAQEPHGIEQVSFLGKDGQLKGAPSSERIRALSLQLPGIKFHIHTDLDAEAALQYIRESRGIAWMPSRIDNCPYAVIECIENQIPFFAAATGGVPELVAPEHRFPLSSIGIEKSMLLREKTAGQALHPYSAESANTLWLDWHAQLKPVVAYADTIALDDLPWVSVCVPYYNQPEFLPHTLNALKQCDYPNLEVIVINDGSNDPKCTAVWDKMVKRYEQLDWSFYELKVNQGLGAARNVAASKATGEYLIFNDSDNCAFPQMIERFVRAMEHSGADCLTCGFVRHHGKGDPLLTPAPGKVIRPLGDFTLLGLLDNVYGDANFCIRRETFEAIGGFCEDRDTAAHDWELLLRLSLEGYDVDVIPTELYWYRHLPNSMMRQADRYQSHLIAVQSWLNKQDSLLSRQLLTQLTIPLFLEHQHLHKSWSRLPKFLQRWQRNRRRGQNSPWWRFWS
ncbi:MAG: glycosyltransferase [Opitutales bacterium]|nr:glycosyltransferase [Opitutales bacterium]